MQTIYQTAGAKEMKHCKDCVYYAHGQKEAQDGCYVEAGKRYIVWEERPACGQFKALKQALREEEQERIAENL